jgi:hypothetical protein
MALVIVATGHHYLLDILGGGIVIALAYVIVKAIPYAVNELSPGPASLNHRSSYGEQNTRPVSSAPPADYFPSYWSREQMTLNQKHRIHDTIVAALANWRHPT